jgi:IS5 family transposase
MERRMGLFGIADFVIQQSRAKATFLDGVQAMINWKPIEKVLQRKLGRNDVVKAGPKAYPALLMLKILLLQQWYGLSDLEVEAALLDRISFVRFAGLSLEDSVPDHTTICRFRNLLIEKDILKSLLDEINRQMEKQGKLVKKGVAVDASIVSSAARPRKAVDVNAVVTDREEPEPSSPSDKSAAVTYSHDSDAAWTKKGKKFYYGYKAHTGVDTTGGLITAVHATPANHSDTGELERVVDDSHLPKGARVYADKGYTSKKNSKMLKGHHCKDAIMDRAWKNKPLTARERQRNKQISQKRSIVERVFGTLKQHYDMARASYLGLMKVQGELLLSALAYNLKRALFIAPSEENCAQ